MHAAALVLPSVASTLRPSFVGRGASAALPTTAVAPLALHSAVVCRYLQSNILVISTWPAWSSSVLLNVSLAGNARHPGLTGPLPFSLTTLTNLVFLDLSSNNFTGALPSGLPASLRVLSLSSNKLIGPVPDPSSFSLGTSAPQLATVWARDNNLNGTLPWGEWRQVRCRRHNTSAHYELNSGPCRLHMQASVRVPAYAMLGLEQPISPCYNDEFPILGS